jgi:hypothetical protein
LDRVYKGVAWQRDDKIRYNIYKNKNSLLMNMAEIK